MISAFTARLPVVLPVSQPSRLSSSGKLISPGAVRASLMLLLPVVLLLSVSACRNDGNTVTESGLHHQAPVINSGYAAGNETAGKTAASTEKTFCAYCKEEIRNARYRAKFVSESGQNVQFRSVECLVRYISENSAGVSAENHGYVLDFIDAKTWLDPSDAVFLLSPNLPSPNGYLTALDRNNHQMISNLLAAYTGQLLEWDEVIEFLRDSDSLKTQSR